MQHTPARRSFLKGRFTKATHIRPPGSVAAFHDLCTQCGACANACPTGIIYRDNDGFPVINLRAGTCLFCSACADACEPAAIAPAPAWSVRAKADASCLSMTGVTCRTCEDQCDAQAIRFRLQTGGRAIPEFDADMCTGCGACAAPCPTNSITFYDKNPQHEETSC
ncbi:ferredoxin-type protein NapF [Celeribacter sp.]|uniref:ferredoxin-type protein NapF n=1 Tax=Celeribacter sp. TaxID=1890673 RepID=UPI003A91653D